MNTLEKTLSIINVSFSDENTLVLDLSNKRSIQIPLDDFPDIAALNAWEREDFEIIDGEYLSFLEIDEIYSLKYLIGYKNQ